MVNFILCYLGYFTIFINDNNFNFFSNIFFLFWYQSSRFKIDFISFFWLYALYSSIKKKIKIHWKAYCLLFMKKFFKLCKFVLWLLIVWMKNWYLFFKPIWSWAVLNKAIFLILVFLPLLGSRMPWDLCYRLGFRLWCSIKVGIVKKQSMESSTSRQYCWSRL